MQVLGLVVCAVRSGRVECAVARCGGRAPPFVSALNPTVFLRFWRETGLLTLESCDAGFPDSGGEQQHLQPVLGRGNVLYKLDSL